MSTAATPAPPSLVEAIGTGWNRFWFTPSAAQPLGRLSQLVCLMTALWLVTFCSDLAALWTADGWLTPSVVHQVTTSGDLNTPIPGISWFFWISQPAVLWTLHAVAIALALGAALGFATRWTLPATFFIALNYIHGAPLVMGLAESVLTMLLGYLALGTLAGDYAQRDVDWPANVTRRLIQLHLCGFYLVIATTKLGTPIWWTGDAAWYLLQDAQQRPLTLAWLAENHLLVNAITHAWLGVELLFPVLIWYAPSRRVMLGGAAVAWLWTGLITGLLGYALIMIVALGAFLEPSEWPGSRQTTAAA